MVAATLSRTRADHRRQMEAKVGAKAARTPLPLSTSRIQLHSASMGDISCPVQVMRKKKHATKGEILKLLHDPAKPAA